MLPTVPRNLYSLRNRLTLAFVIAACVQVVFWLGINMFITSTTTAQKETPSILSIMFAPPPPDVRPEVKNTQKPQKLKSGQESAVESPLVEQSIPEPEILTETKTENLIAQSITKEKMNNPVHSGGREQSQQNNVETERTGKLVSFETISQGLELSLPPYPPAAKRWGYQGTVRLKIYIAPNGLVEKTEIVSSSGHSILDNSAVKTVLSSWSFHAPGKPVTVMKDFVFILE